MSARIVVAGEALIDLIVGEDPRHPEALPGGSPANTAIALARLGAEVAFVGRFGPDRFGDLLRSNLAANGVDLTYAVAAPEPTSLAVVALGADGGASYAFHVSGTADWGWREDELPQPDADVLAVHAGSLALAMEPGATVLAKWYVEQHAHRVTSLDPNIRPALVGPRDEYVARLTGLVAASDIVKVSVEDLAWAYPGADPVGVLLGWQRDLGPALVLLTLGGDGAVAVNNGRTIRLPAADVSVVDTVGAGDAFNGGLLHWLGEHGLLRQDRLADLADEAVERALGHAITVSGLACAKPGADPPTAAEVDAASAPRAGG